MAAAAATDPMHEDLGELDPQEDQERSDPVVALARRAEGGLTFRFAFDLPKVPSVMAVQTWTHQQMLNGLLLAMVVAMAAFLIYEHRFASTDALPAAAVAHNIRPNVDTPFSPGISDPVVGAGTYIDPLASVIGAVQLGAHVFVAPFASVRGDEGQPIVIGDGSNVQDGVVIHALETFDGSKPVEKNLVTVGGKKYAVWVGKNVSMAHQSQVHGPALIGENTFVGMQSLVFRSSIGSNVVIEPGAKVIGVTVADGRYIPAGSAITTQAQADALPEITPDYAFATLNKGVLEVNHAFADAYGAGHSSDGASVAPAGGH